MGFVGYFFCEMEYMYEKTVNFRLFIVVYAGDYGIRIERREGVVHLLQFSFYFFFQIIFGLVGDFVYCTEYKAKFFGIILLAISARLFTANLTLLIEQFQKAQ